VEISAYIVWNVFITLVLTPIWFQIRANIAELKRQDILLNKTREEMARDYVTKAEMKDDMNAIMDRIKKIDEKLDKLFEAR
jgi:archaellum component FlaC|tara:strand:+ start:36 stop:278 length:243 start_codon:yes stop_codon:yes gene_type:complete